MLRRGRGMGARSSTLARGTGAPLASAAPAKMSCRSDTGRPSTLTDVTERPSGVTCPTWTSPSWRYVAYFMGFRASRGALTSSMMYLHYVYASVHTRHRPALRLHHDAQSHQ